MAIELTTTVVLDQGQVDIAIKEYVLKTYGLEVKRVTGLVRNNAQRPGDDDYEAAGANVICKAPGAKS